ncbi:stress-regulated transcription factor RPN4 [Aspergillus undulatus]|uniref:stress-regulated transcription factor RPN4 n=1 Tax=Aspergillus undulatus TaxID=1810928 RepID=UPI003CCDCEAD
MLSHPSVRKGAITEPASVPFINYPDSVYIQDDQFFNDYSQELPLQFLSQEQTRLQSPFQYHQNLNLVAPPSPVPSSPLSSPASSVSHFPATTAASADYSAVFDGSSSFEAPSMTPASSYNPEIHIQHSGSPQPQSYLPQYTQPQFVFDNSPMLAQQQYLNNNSHGWENNLHAHNVPRMSHQYNGNASHQTPSSSGRSPGNSFNNRAAYNSAPTKPLPTPVHTPVQQSYLTPQFQKNELSHDGSFSFVPEQQQQNQQQQSSEHSHSHAPSVSTVSHNSPITPQNHFEDVEDSKVAPNGEKHFSDRRPDNYLHELPDYNVPKLNRTITDAIQDELFNSTVMQTPQVSKQQNQQNLLPQTYHNLLGNRLQAANSARAQSPSSINRERSPFRQSSPYSAEYENEAFRQQPVTSMPTSQPGMEMQHQSQGEPNTISPKDAVLSDFHEGGDDHGLPLPYQSDFNIGDALGLRQENNFHPAPSFPSMDSFPTQYNQTASGTSQPFFGQPQQQSRRPSHQQQQQNNYLHHTPEFPASLPRFESTNSEVYGHDLTSPTLSKTAVPIQRPQNMSSDGGTYTCTYHGCTQRFESPAKLQKHKREAHRQTTPGGHLAGRDAASRNSQAGPHKCTRENPSTGKPCNSIFSRPYDLTRHEDTIHNARKQKVRCHLCTEEKTFSRNDALTRHMRVVHPEVDWPGKQRRRGRE